MAGDRRCRPGHTVTSERGDQQSDARAEEADEHAPPAVRAAELRHQQWDRQQLAQSRRARPSGRARVTSAQACRAAPSRNSRTGKPPAAVVNCAAQRTPLQRRNQRDQPQHQQDARRRGRPRQRHRDRDRQPIGGDGQPFEIGCADAMAIAHPANAATARLAAPTARAARACGRRRDCPTACARSRRAATRSSSACHRCKTPVANTPSLRRTPACSRRTMISESSLPQPL